MRIVSLARRFLYSFLLIYCLAGTLKASDTIPVAFASKLISLGPTESNFAKCLVAIQRQTGIVVKLEGVRPDRLFTQTIGPKPLWAALEELSQKDDLQFRLLNQGESLSIVGGRSAVASSIDGAFRTVPRRIIAERDFATGVTLYKLELLLHWEPRFAVFRIESQPTITSLQDNSGRSLRVRPVAAKSAISGSEFLATIPIQGIERSVSAFNKLEGKFHLTASPKMLSFAFTDLTQPLPIKMAIEGVSVELTRLTKFDDRTELDCNLVYPEGHPNFESFESWTGRNTIELLAPDGKTRHRESTFDISTQGRNVSATYRFELPPKGPNLAALGGWTLLLTTPAPLAEYPVEFRFDHLPLP